MGVVFTAEVAVMLSIVKDRRAWIGGHSFELLVVLVSSPLIPLALALALRLLVVAKALTALKVAKAIKLATLGKTRAPAAPQARAPRRGGVRCRRSPTVLYTLTSDSPLEGERADRPELARDRRHGRAGRSQ